MEATKALVHIRRGRNVERRMPVALCGWSGGSLPFVRDGQPTTCQRCREKFYEMIK